MSRVRLRTLHFPDGLSHFVFVTETGQFTASRGEATFTAATLLELILAMDGSPEMIYEWQPAILVYQAPQLDQPAARLQFKTGWLSEKTETPIFYPHEQRHPDMAVMAEKAHPVTATMRVLDNTEENQRALGRLVQQVTAVNTDLGLLIVRQGRKLDIPSEE